VEPVLSDAGIEDGVQYYSVTPECSACLRKEILCITYYKRKNVLAACAACGSARGRCEASWRGTGDTETEPSESGRSGADAKRAKKASVPEAAVRVTRKNRAYVDLTKAPEEPERKKKMRVPESVLERWLNISERQLAVAERAATALEVMAATGAATAEAAGVAWRDLLPASSQDAFTPLMFGMREGRDPEPSGSGTQQDDEEREGEADDEGAGGEMKGVAGPSGIGGME
jgi:hypothetical protein